MKKNFLRCALLAALAVGLATPAFAGGLKLTITPLRQFVDARVGHFDVGSDGVARLVLPAQRTEDHAGRDEQGTFLAQCDEGRFREATGSPPTDDRRGGQLA